MGPEEVLSQPSDFVVGKSYTSMGKLNFVEG